MVTRFLTPYDVTRPQWDIQPRGLHCEQRMQIFYSFRILNTFRFLCVTGLFWLCWPCRGHLTHWGRVTHMCVGELPIIGSDNGSSLDRGQAIIWTNAGILLIRTLGINFSEILSEIHAFSFKKMHFKMSSGKRRPSCLGLNVLTHWGLVPPNGFRSLGQIWLR